MHPQHTHAISRQRAVPPSQTRHHIYRSLKVLAADAMGDKGVPTKVAHKKSKSRADVDDELELTPHAKRLYVFTGAMVLVEDGEYGCLQIPEYFTFLLQGKRADNL